MNCLVGPGIGETTAGLNGGNKTLSPEIHSGHLSCSALFRVEAHVLRWRRRYSDLPPPRIEFITYAQKSEIALGIQHWLHGSFSANVHFMASG